MKKAIHFILFLSIYYSSSSAQSLITNFPQLNAGGYINAIVDDSTNNKIYIAGNFTTVNGNARRNIARLSYNFLSNTYTIDTWNPITAMVGEIYCLAKYNNDLHIGGNFTSANGSALNNHWSVITIPTASISSFDPDQGGAINDITDFELEGTTLFVTGTGIIYDNGTDARINFGKFNANDLSVSNFPINQDPLILNPSMSWGSLEAVRLHISGNRIYLCGRNLGGALNDGIVAFDKNTMLLVNSFNPSFTFEQVIDCESYNGKLYVLNSKIWPGGDEILEINESTNVITTNAFVTTTNGTASSIARYKNYLFVAGGFQYFQNTNHNYLGVVDLNSTSSPKTKINWNEFPNTGFDNRYAIHVSRNRLFVSDNALNTISSTAKNGMASFCLEPYNPVALSVASANVCPSESHNYSIQTVPYAFGYTWWYTGTNATITGGNSANISIAFGENATSGILYVAPFSRCNLYADTLVYNITVNPRPNANAGIDSTLNCVRLNLNLNASSTSSPINYQWSGPSSFSSTMTNPTINLDGEYILTVTNTSTGCTQKDTVLISQDTITPNVSLPAGTFILTCIDTNITLNGSSTTIPTSLYWNKFNGGIYANPANVDSIGQYFLVVTNTRNGCKDSNFVMVTENRTAPDIEISSHSGIMSLSIDTLTCINDSILVVGNSITLNTTFHWEDTTGIISTNDSLIITETAAYSLFVTDNTNGCTSQQNFFIDEYKTIPQLSLPTGLTDITCSNDTLVLDGNSLSSNTNLNWTGPNSFTSSDPATINQIGYFVLSVTNSDNGCVNKDSVLVSQIPLIEIELHQDTLVCSGSPVDLNVSVIGNFASLNYAWSNGGNNASVISVSPITTTEYFVTVSDGFGCTGIDSVTVSIPSPISDSILTFASCDSTIGEIQIYPSGGISPYTYSIDGINFQTQNSFIVPFGNHTITIRDSLGCLHTTSATVNDNTQLPEPDFLVSTTHFIGDTLVLVNISNPQPDSLAWVFPIGTQLILNDIETPWVILPDTGTYQITLKGIYGNCESEKTKTIYVRDIDTSVANFYNLNGIDSILISPNPNTGIFDLEVTLHRKQDFSILIYDLSGNLQWSDFTNEEEFYLQNIQLSNLQNGTYLIRIVAEFDARSVYFIIQH
jgi:hypothetical protein